MYGDTCTTFLWYDGRKTYAHVQACTGMIVYFHVQLHACTCILMVQWYWFLQCNNYLLAKRTVWYSRFCSVCKRYSAKENIHCDVCDSCPTKVRGLQGRTTVYRVIFRSLLFSPFFTRKKFSSVLEFVQAKLYQKGDNLRHRNWLMQS